MTHPIDTAYVDIVPVDKSLEKLQRDIDKAMKKIEKEAQKDLDKIDKDFDDAMKEIDKHFANMDKNAEKHFRDLEKIVDNSLTEVENDFEHTFSFVEDKFTEFGHDSDRSFRRARSRFFEPLADGFRNLGGMVSELGRAMLQLVSGIGGAITSNPLMALIIALVPAIIALSAALSQLIGLVGLVPAGLAVLLTAIIPMVVAFQNFGEAVSALADGDIDKINEALKKLSPSAASVAREIAALLPQLRAFQRGVQEAFFSQVRGDFTRLLHEIFPTMEKGFISVASAMGRLVSSFADLLGSQSTIQVFRELFASTARIIDRLSPSFVVFADMLLSTVHEALPFIERLAAAFGRALDTFSAFVNKSIETGEFDAFIEDAITTVKELIDLAKELGALIGTIFGGTEDAGHDFIKSLTEMTVKLNDFLKSADGQDALQILVFSVKTLGIVLQGSLDILIFFFRVFKNMMATLETIGRGFVSFVTTIGEWLGKIPEIVTTFIGSLPGMVTGFINQMIDQALMAIGVGVGLILFQIQELPRQIIGFLMSLPQRIGAIFNQIGPLIALALQGAVDFGRNIIVNGFNEIIAFILSVPDRIKELIPTFGGAGKSLIQSFMNGFRSVGGFIGDVAGDIVGAVKGFLNKAIDKINSGISIIDNVLPGDLGRIPRLADGALVRHRPGGILANVGEGNEDEVVAPLSKLEGMLKGGPSVTFGAGAINVNFSGVMPTESEARDVGNAVGQGIIDMITKRNMRAQVRAV